MKRILQMQVKDRPGVLDRVVGLIRRRGWNIDSLTAGDIGGGETQITARLEGRDIDLQALGDYFYEMDAVKSWRELSEAEDMLRELLLFHIPASHALLQRENVRVVCRQDSLAFCEYTDVPSRVDAFAQELHEIDVACVRSGCLAMVNLEKEVQ